MLHIDKFQMRDRTVCHAAGDSISLEPPASKSSYTTTMDVAHFFGVNYGGQVQTLPKLCASVPSAVSNALAPFADGAHVVSRRAVAKLLGYLDTYDAGMPCLLKEYLEEMRRIGELTSTVIQRRQGKITAPDIRWPPFHPDRRSGLLGVEELGENIVASVGTVGSLRDLSIDRPNAAVINGGVFLLDPREDDYFFSAIGDVVGMQCSSALMRTPPQLGMPALVQTAGEWSVIRPCEDQAELVVNGMLKLTTSSDRGRLYFRRSTPGYRSPTEPGATHFAVVGLEIVAWKKGGDLIVPQAGTVISSQDAELTELLSERPALKWQLRDVALQFACQCGPLLVDDGRPTDVEKEMSLFRLGSRAEFQAPITFHIHEQEERNRTALGVMRDGRCASLVVEMVTLQTLSEIASEIGFRLCIGMDGGGSSQMFHRGGAIATSEGHRAERFGQWDRLVPLAVLIE